MPSFKPRPQLPSAESVGNLSSQDLFNLASDPRSKERPIKRVARAFSLTKTRDVSANPGDIVMIWKSQPELLAEAVLVVRAMVAEITRSFLLYATDLTLVVIRVCGKVQSALLAAKCHRQHPLAVRLREEGKPAFELAPDESDHHADPLGRLCWKITNLDNADLLMPQGIQVLTALASSDLHPRSLHELGSKAVLLGPQLTSTADGLRLTCVILKVLAQTQKKLDFMVLLDGLSELLQQPGISLLSRAAELVAAVELGLPAMFATKLAKSLGMLAPQLSIGHVKRLIKLEVPQESSKAVKDALLVCRNNMAVAAAGAADDTVKKWLESGSSKGECTLWLLAHKLQCDGNCLALQKLAEKAIAALPHVKPPSRKHWVVDMLLLDCFAANQATYNHLALSEYFKGGARRVKDYHQRYLLDQQQLHQQAQAGSGGAELQPQAGGAANHLEEQPQCNLSAMSMNQVADHLQALLNTNKSKVEPGELGELDKLDRVQTWMAKAGGIVFSHTKPDASVARGRTGAQMLLHVARQAQQRQQQ